MTTRHSGYVVILRDDVREDDDEAIRTALRMVSGVVSVRPVEASYEQSLAQARRDDVWRDALLDLARKGPQS